MASFTWPLANPFIIAPSVAQLPAIATNGSLGTTTDTYSLYIFEQGIGWVLVTGSGAPITSLNTNSIDTIIASNIISSNLNLSSNAASAGNTLVNLDIESTGVVGLRAQISNAAIEALFSATSPLLYSAGAFSIQQAGTSQNGYLSSTDWNTFNGKQPSGSYITALTGDVTASGPGSAIATLATVNSNVGSFGTVTQVGSFTVNAKGLITAASNTSIQIAESQVTNLVSDLAGKQPVGNYITALTGDASAAGPGSAALTLATVNANTGSFGSSTAIPNFTVNAKGLVTAAGTNAVVAPAGTLTGTTLASNVVSSSLTSVGTITSGTWTGTTIAIAEGGTGQTTANTALNALLPSQTGQSGNVLTSDGTNTSWQPSSGTSYPPTLTWMNVSTSSTTPGTSDTAIVFTVVNFDTASGYNNTTGVYTIPTTGIWQINVETALAGTTFGGGAFMRTAIYKNGSLLRYVSFNAAANSDTVVSCNGASMEHFTVGDTVQIFSASNIGTALDGGNEKNFWNMALVGK